MRASYRLRPRDPSEPAYPDLSKYAELTHAPAGDPWADRPRSLPIKKTEWSRYLVHFDGRDDLARKTATVFTRRSPKAGQLIQLGKTPNSRQTVSKVEPLEGTTPQLGDLVLG